MEWENTANTAKPENDLKTEEPTTYIWGRRGDATEKNKMSKP